MRRQKIDVLPPRTPSFLQGMWVLWAYFAVALLAISAWGFALHAPVHLSRTVTGTFESHAQNVALTIPAGVALGDVMISEGDLVQQGQKLAQFDQTKLHQKIHALLQQRRAAEALLACWQSPSLDMHHPEPDPALASCYNRHRQDSLTRQQIMFRRDSLKRETALAVAELVARANSVHPPAGKILMLRAALERETLRNVIREVEFELALLLQQQEADRLAHIETLTREVAQITQNLKSLESIAGTPWLLAPRTGRIEHVRDLIGTPANDHALTLAKIRIDAPAAYLAQFRLPASEGQTLQLGDVLDVTLSGLPRSRPHLAGIIKDIKNSPAADGTMDREFSVQLAATGRAKNTDLSTVPAGARSVMNVALPSQNFGEILQHATQRMLRSF